MFFQNAYYSIKPILPRRLQLFVRRLIIAIQIKKYQNTWPIDQLAGQQPEKWKGWPDGKRFALILTHDVESSIGLANCAKLMAYEKRLGFRSSFNFVPKRYHVPKDLRDNIIQNGFEVGVHGLYHDGKLYSSKRVFIERASDINHYLKEWRAVGFRSPAMHHNLEWLHALDIKYDLSTFDTDPFEPYPDGVQTIFPFRVSNNGFDNSYIEMPYTLPQDFTLFILLGKNTEIWKRKLDWICDKGGMVLMNTHPDYMVFSGQRKHFEKYPVEYYLEFLEHINTQYTGAYWHVLPHELATFWAANNFQAAEITSYNNASPPITSCN